MKSALFSRRILPLAPMSLSGSLRSIVHPAALLRPSRPRPVLSRETALAAQRGSSETAVLGGVPVELLGYEQALNVIVERARGGGLPPLAVASANLDHVKHFGRGGRWAGSLENQAGVDWLTLLDGAPLVSQAEKITGRTWPRLAGSDLICPVLDAAQAAGLRVGIVGGTPEVHGLIRARFAVTYPKLAVSGWWAPERGDLTDPDASRALAAEIRHARTDILVVCLGKPRQELWISEYGGLTGAKVMLAFGAVVDFLAGRIRRAPAPVRNLGLEWAWRLALEPRRLARRYLVDGPEAYLKLRQQSGKTSIEWKPPAPRRAATLMPSRTGSAKARARIEGFSPRDVHTEVAVVVVTYNSEKDIPPLLQSLRRETRDQSIKVIVADNSPTPATLRALADHPDVFAFATGGNLGYAAGINAAIRHAGSTDAYLVLNPDMRVERGAVFALRERMVSSGAGVAVPLLLDDDGSPYPSIRREPSISRAFGDALMGGRIPGRPAWLGEMDFDPESYLHPHMIDWSTGAALLIRPDLVDLVGDWDERYFLYSEETDFLRRVRSAGASIWFEPQARMSHCRGGSGTSPALAALMAANRIRYVRKYHDRWYAAAFRAAVVLSAALRAPLPQGGVVLAAVGREKSWERLPQAEHYRKQMPDTHPIPSGAVIIPAHNEAAVLGRTLKALESALASGRLEVIVACNGCSDDTSEIAHSFGGVQVIEVAEASKVAALNAGDLAASKWPRLYLDADIELPEDALCATLDRLAHDQSVLCARPAFVYATEGASWPVRAYYRARNRLPQASQSMWGAGVYGLNLQGHSKFGAFPDVTADDCFVNGLYEDREKATVECPPVTVRTPRAAKALLATLKRVYRGNAELGQAGRPHTAQTITELVMSVRGPSSAFDAAVYAAFALAGRLGPRRAGAWERDNSSRIIAG